MLLGTSEIFGNVSHLRKYDWYFSSEFGFKFLPESVPTHLVYAFAYK